jgi:hypothetical protein
MLAPDSLVEEEVESPRGESDGAPPSVEHPVSKAKESAEILRINPGDLSERVMDGL